MKMNKKNMIILLLLVGVLIVGGGIFAFTQSSIGGNQYVEGKQFGYLECASDGRVDKFDQSIPASDQFFISCHSIGLSESCTITLRAPDEGFISTGSSLQYQICTSHSNCDEIKVVPGVNAGYDGETSSPISIPANKFLRAGFFKGILSLTPRTGATYDIYGTVFSIKIRDAFRADNGQRLSRKGICVLEDNYFEGRAITFADPGFDLNYEGIEGNKQTLNSPNAVYTYFSGFTTIPAESSRIENYGGREAYCLTKGSRAEIVALKRVNTNTGSYRVVSDEVLGTEDCCNGDVTPGKVCQDHEWIDSTGSSCSVWSNCEGSLWNAFGSKQAIRQQCVNNACVDQIITVSCWDDNDCSTGACAVDYQNPNNNKCVESGTVNPPSFWVGGWTFNNLLIISLFAGLIIFLGLLLVLKNAPWLDWSKDKWLIAGLSLVVAGLVGWLVFMFWWVAIVALAILIVLKVMI